MAWLFGGPFAPLTFRTDFASFQTKIWRRRGKRASSFPLRFRCRPCQDPEDMGTLCLSSSRRRFSAMHWAVVADPSRLPLLNAAAATSRG